VRWPSEPVSALALQEVKGLEIQPLARIETVESRLVVAWRDSFIVDTRVRDTGECEQEAGHP
jgi:hypothetical protein